MPTRAAVAWMIAIDASATSASLTFFSSPMKRSCNWKTSVRYACFRVYTFSVCCTSCSARSSSASVAAGADAAAYMAL